MSQPATTLPTREEEHAAVRSAWSDYMYHEAADRGYDAAAASEAKNVFYLRKGAYEKRHKVLWNEDDFAVTKEITSAKVNALADPLQKQMQEQLFPEGQASIGHNNPPPDDVDPTTTPAFLLSEKLKGNHKEIVAKAEQLIAAEARIPAKCESEEIATKLTNTVALIGKITKALTDAHKVEKDPYLTGGKIVDGFFGNYKTNLAGVKAKAERVLGDHLKAKADAERKEREAAAEKLRKEAEAQQAAADALVDAGRPEEAEATYHAVERIHNHADHLETSAARPVASVASTRTASGTASLRTVTVGTIENRDLLDLEKLRPYIKLEHLQQAVNQFVATGGRELRGAKIEEQTSATVRGKRS